MTQNWCHADGERAFGRPTRDLSPEAFLGFCRLLDVRLLVVESPGLLRLVAASPAAFAAVPPGLGPYRLYRFAPVPVPDIWEGCYRGRVHATSNRIRIDDPPAGAFVLNHHFAHGFRGGPGVTAEPFVLPGLGAPFLRVTVDSARSSVELNFCP